LKPPPAKLLDLFDAWELCSHSVDLATLELVIAGLRPVYTETFKQLLEKRPFGHLGNGIASRQFAVTEKGFMGLVPLGAQVGDAVCIFHGAETPFLLRKVPNLGGEISTLHSQHARWELVGQVYAHGLMYGKGMGLGIEAEWFDII
jgi:hypothetical protein